MAPEQQNGAPLQVEIDEPTARGVYTNLALISHSETEFILDFLFLQPQTFSNTPPMAAPKTKVLARLVSSPIHAKRLLWALKDNLEKYEARFGPIQAGEPAASAAPSKPAGFYQ